MKDQTNTEAELAAPSITEKKPSTSRKKTATKKATPKKKATIAESAETSSSSEHVAESKAEISSADSRKKTPAKKTPAKKTSKAVSTKKVSLKESTEPRSLGKSAKVSSVEKEKKASSKKIVKDSHDEMEETKEARSKKAKPSPKKRVTKTAAKSTKKVSSVEEKAESNIPALDQESTQKNRNQKSLASQNKKVPVESKISVPEEQEEHSVQGHNLEQRDSINDAQHEEKENQGNNRRRGRRGRSRSKKTTQNNTELTAIEDIDLLEENIEARDDGTDALNTPQESKPSSEKKALSVERASEATPSSKSRRKMFVSVLPDEQVEVVLCEEGQVQEYYIEMLQQAKVKGNIYKAVIHNVDANLQAAFVNYGSGKNGFLQIDEVHPEYYNTPHDQTKQRKYPPIQKVLKPGQEILVQIVKEPTGNKGAFLTTYLSFAGRFLVLTPGREQIGVSRKVDDEKERTRLREMLNGLSVGTGLGVIVRTVSIGASKTNLQKDLQSLKKLWKEVRGHGTSDVAPSLIYQEMDLTTRSIRDYLTEQVTEVWIDDEKTAESVAELAKVLFPKKRNLVRVHKDEGTSLFERFNVQRQLDQIHSREVVLPSGGRLVIDPTEALTAIDINSGRSGGKNTFEDMAYRTNMEAAKMIPLQLRLRDIGGQIVADFIEMRDKAHWREVEKTLRQGMKVDRARYDVGKIGSFGMMEIVRQRLGTSAISVSMEVCPCCKGAGVRRNMEWQSQQIFKDIQRQMRAALSQKKTELVYEVDADLAFHLLNQKRQRICDLEELMGITLMVVPKS